MISENLGWIIDGNNGEINMIVSNCFVQAISNVFNKMNLNISTSIFQSSFDYITLVSNININTSNAGWNNSTFDGFVDTQSTTFFDVNSNSGLFIGDSVINNIVKSINTNDVTVININGDSYCNFNLVRITNFDRLFNVFQANISFNNVVATTTVVTNNSSNTNKSTVNFSGDTFGSHIGTVFDIPNTYNFTNSLIDWNNVTFKNVNAPNQRAISFNVCKAQMNTALGKILFLEAFAQQCAKFLPL